MNLFLPTFDEGWLTDGRWKRVYLSDAIASATIPVLPAIGGSLVGTLGSTVNPRHRDRLELVAKKVFQLERLYSAFITRVRGCWSMPFSTRSRMPAHSYQFMH